MTWILAIDPGSEQSAVLRYDVVHHTVDCAGILKNMEVLEWLDATEGDVLVVEDTKAYTIPKKKGGSFFPEELRITARWVGRFIERWGGSYALVDRRRVKQLLCGVQAVGDPQIKDAILDRFGGRFHAVGGVRCRKCKGKGWFGAGRLVCTECDGKQWLYPPGPLTGIHDDLWAALAVAIAYCEEMDVPHSMGGGEG